MILKTFFCPLLDQSWMDRRSCQSQWKEEILLISSYQQPRGSYSHFSVESWLSCQHKPIPSFDLWQVQVGDFVKVRPEDPHMPLFISCVCYMWEAANGDKMFHCRWFRYKPNALCLLQCYNRHYMFLSINWL